MPFPPILVPLIIVVPGRPLVLPPTFPLLLEHRVILILASPFPAPLSPLALSSLIPAPLLKPVALPVPIPRAVAAPNGVAHEPPHAHALGLGGFLGARAALLALLLLALGLGLLRGGRLRAEHGPVVVVRAADDGRQEAFVRLPYRVVVAINQPPGQCPGNIGQRRGLDAYEGR